MNNRRPDLWHNPWLELIGRWILGVTFIYASYHKILAPAEFAKIVYGYGLFPGPVINLIAVIVPFIELVVGLALIFGIFPRAAALIIIAMLGSFMAAIAINLVRGHEFDCGCFSVGGPQTAATLWFTVVRDLVLLAIGIHTFRFGTAHARRFTLTRG